MKLLFVISVISFIFVTTEAEDYQNDYSQGYWSQFMQPQQQMMNSEMSQYRRYYQYDPSMYNNWYQMMPREPVNPEAFNYFGNLRNSYGEPLLPQQETQQQEEPDMMSVMFSGMKTQRDVNHPETSQENLGWNQEEEEEMINLPPVDEEDMGIIGEILAKIAQTISEGQLIKNKEERHKPTHHHSSETVKKEVNNRQSHSMEYEEVRPDDCEFEMTDFLFPERSFTEKLRRCQEQQEMERMNGDINTEKASEEVVAIMELEKHFINGDECICVMDFQCENDKIITDGKTIIDTRIHSQHNFEDMMRSHGGICASPLEVCCKLDNGHHNHHHSEAPENHEKPHHTSHHDYDHNMEEDNLIPVSHKPEGRAEKPCKCVPFYQCSLENTLIKYGEGILEERFGLKDENETTYPQCEGVLDVCCAEY